MRRCRCYVCYVNIFCPYVAVDDRCVSCVSETARRWASGNRTTLTRCQLLTSMGQMQSGKPLFHMRDINMTVMFELPMYFWIDYGISLSPWSMFIYMKCSSVLVFCCAGIFLWHCHGYMVVVSLMVTRFLWHCFDSRGDTVVAVIWQCCGGTMMVTLLLWQLWCCHCHAVVLWQSCWHHCGSVVIMLWWHCHDDNVMVTSSW